MEFTFCMHVNIKVSTSWYYRFWWKWPDIPKYLKYEIGNIFAKYLKKASQLLLRSILMQIIEIFPVLFVVTCLCLNIMSLDGEETTFEEIGYVAYTLWSLQISGLFKTTFGVFWWKSQKISDKTVLITVSHWQKFPNIENRSLHEGTSATRFLVFFLEKLNR